MRGFYIPLVLSSSACLLISLSVAQAQDHDLTSFLYAFHHLNLPSMSGDLQLSDVSLETGNSKEGTTKKLSLNDKNPDGTPKYPEVDVTGSFSLVGTDNEETFTASPGDGRVIKQTVVTGWKRSENERPHYRDRAVVVWKELPLSAGPIIDLSTFDDLIEDVILLHGHPSRASQEKFEKGIEVTDDDIVYRDFISDRNHYLEMALLSMNRGEEAVVTVAYDKPKGKKRYFLRLVDYAVNQYCCCMEGVEKGPNNTTTKYCECSCGGYVCLLKDHTACCKCCFLTGGLLGLCTATLMEA